MGTKSEADPYHLTPDDIARILPNEASSGDVSTAMSYIRTLIKSGFSEERAREKSVEYITFMLKNRDGIAHPTFSSDNEEY